MKNSVLTVNANSLVQIIYLCVKLMVRNSLFHFVFFGFSPKSKKKLFDFLKPITYEKKTVVLFVSSHKIAQTLTTMSEVLPDRKISVCKEITKLNEKVFYGFPKKVLNVILSDKKYSLGEFVVVVEREKNDSKIDKKNISS